MVDVSVLLPVRNAGPELVAALESLRRQTLRSIEILAVDDGSQDETRAHLEAAAHEDARLRVLEGGGRGLVAALNLAARAASAELLARMDGDDLAHSERLEQQVRRLRDDPQVDILGTRVEALGPTGPGFTRYLTWSNALTTHQAIVDDLFVESPLVHPSVMLRRACLERMGGYRNFNGPEDYDLWLRAARGGARFGKLEQVLLAWRDGPQRLTRSSPRYAPEAFLALKLEALQAGPLRHPRPLVIWGAGPIAKRWARALRSAGYELRAFVDVHPRRIGARVQGAPVIALGDVLACGDALHLSAVGQPGARDRVRAAAAGLGLRYGIDVLAVA